MTPTPTKEFQDTLWKAADKLRGSMDASQYYDIVLGLVFLKYVTDAFKVALNPRTNVATEPDQYETSVPGIFTAGDMHRGQSLVVWAIREGRKAAEAVDASLMGYSNL